MDLDKAIARMRSGIDSRDKQALSRLISAYRDVWMSLQPQWDAIAAGLEAGKDKAWLRQRVAALQAQIEERLNEYSAFVSQEQRLALRDAMQAAAHDTGMLVLAAYGPAAGKAIRTLWHDLPVEAIETTVGMFGPDSPLMRKMIERLGPEVAQRVAQRVIEGIALGYHPTKLQGMLERELGAGLQWSMTATRTTMMQAYWRTTSGIYKQNDHIVKGWYWRAALDDRTCMACAMMDGTFHTLNETLNGHYNCRCTMVPAVRSFRELGLNVDGPPEYVPRSGRQWFENLPKAEQMRRMGRARWKAWQDGKFDLGDIVGQHKDEVWGQMVVERSLKDILSDPTLWSKYASWARSGKNEIR